MKLSTKIPFLLDNFLGKMTYNQSG